MGARLRIFLASEENHTLFELHRATTVPQRVKDCAQVLRLNHQGWYLEKIVAYFKWNVKTVRKTLHRWQDKGLGRLWDALHRGSQPRWHPRGTSQICPACGINTGKKELRHRIHQCQCGYRTNRDFAAAQVIMQRGLSSVGQTQIMLVEGKVFGGLIHG